MAANDYYNDDHKYYSSSSRPIQQPGPNNLYQPNSSQSPLAPSTTNHTFGTTDHSSNAGERYYEASHPPKPPQKEQYTESIPMESSAKIAIAPTDFSKQDTQYPPSPEARLESQPLRSRRTKKGFFSGKIPWVVYVTTMVQITVFIVEIIKNSIITGSPIMIRPQFNPMIGPSTYVQINMGARFVPCMRTDPEIQNANPPISWPCPNTTSSAASNHCDLSTLCGFGGFNDDNPNQWFRFIVPMFLHAGLIHIAFNMLLQLTIGREIEQAIGSVRFALVYFSSGIFGFVLGGNFAAKAIASTGASGCLFGIIAITLLDLIYHWQERPHPVRDLMWILADIVISFVLGLLPGLDNFSHIGGFLMGLVAGICILHSPAVLRQRIGECSMPYQNVGSEPDITNAKLSTVKASARPANVTAFAKEPIGFFKGRKPLWWVWWLIRAGALIGVLVGFIVLLNNFYTYRDTCSWCKYLTCLPINGWCNIGNLQLTNTTTNGKSKRHLAGVLVEELLQRAT